MTSYDLDLISQSNLRQEIILPYRADQQPINFRVSISDSVDVSRLNPFNPHVTGENDMTTATEEAVVINQPQAVPPTVRTEEEVSAQAAPKVEEVQVEEKAPLTRIQQMIHSAYQTFQESGGTGSTVEVQDVRLYSTHVEVSVGGIQKAVSLFDFKEILDSMLTMHEPSIPAFKVPNGTFHIATNGSLMQISCYYPAAERVIKYGDSRTFKVPFPNVIISHQLKKKDKQWHVEKTKYYSTPKAVGSLPDKFIMDTSRSNEIYLIAIPNMYFGNNTMPKVFTDNLRGLDYYFQVIFDAPFNNDLGVRAFSSHTNVAEWFDEWSKLSEFPYEKLKR
jgi:hypothetical protein